MVHENMQGEEKPLYPIPMNIFLENGNMRYWITLKFDNEVMVFKEVAKASQTVLQNHL